MTHTILIVDDQRGVLRVLENALESLGQRFIITGVLSGEEALLEARLSHVDLLITDIRLPGMSGLELFTRIRILRPQAKTFLLTGLTDPDTRSKAVSAGADAFFSKPIDLAEFLDTVVRVLGLKLDGPVPVPPPHPPAEIEGLPPQSGTLSDRLARLRLDLDAETVLLVDETGQVMARTGDLQDPEIEPRLLSSVSAVLEAGSQLSRLLKGRHSGSIHYLPGEPFDLVIAPIGDGRGLVAAAAHVPENSGTRVADLARAAAEEIAGILAQIGFRIPSPEAVVDAPPASDHAAPEAAPPTPSDEALENLFDADPLRDIREQADSFWESAETTPAPGTPAPDSLSYEQAQRLGLAPDSEE